MGKAVVIERAVPAGRTDRTAPSHSNGSDGRKAFAEADIATWEKDDYARLLAEFEHLFNTSRGSVGSERYEALADLIEAYEEVQYPMREPSAK